MLEVREVSLATGGGVAQLSAKGKCKNDHTGTGGEPVVVHAAFCFVQSGITGKHEWFETFIRDKRSQRPTLALLLILRIALCRSSKNLT